MHFSQKLLLTAICLVTLPVLGNAEYVYVCRSYCGPVSNGLDISQGRRYRYEYGLPARDKRTAFNNAISACNEIARTCGADYRAFVRVDSAGRVEFLNENHCLYTSALNDAETLYEIGKSQLSIVLSESNCR